MKSRLEQMGPPKCKLMWFNYTCFKQGVHSNQYWCFEGTTGKKALNN